MGGGKGSKEFQKQMKAARDEVKKLGESASEGAKLLAQIGEEGMISAEMVGLAMEMETSPGGKFYNGMEMASQTMQGLFSTLQDDAMQLAGNVFEPLSDALTKKVLPAAIGAVGALNNLFEADGRVELSVETREAIATVEGLEKKIAEVKTKYLTEAIEIQVKYDQATDLLNQLDELSQKLKTTPKELWSESDQAQLSTLNSQLSELVPNFQSLVGEDGLLKQDIQTVQKLTEEYYNLALAKAASAALEEAYRVQIDADLEVKRIEKRISMFEKEKAAAEAAAESYDKLSYILEDIEYNADNTALPYAEQLSWIEQGTGILQSYIDTYGNLAGLKLPEDFALGTLFDMMGNIKPAEEIISSTKATEDLVTAIGALSDKSLELQKGQLEIVGKSTEEIQANQEALAIAKSASAEAAQTVTDLTSLQAEMAQGSASVAESAAAANEAVTKVQEAGDKLGESEWEPDLKANDEATPVVEKATKAGEEFAARTFVSTLRFQMVNKPPSLSSMGFPHKDGLEYVPYDNYPALLHKGEMVLTAEEAEAIRNLSSKKFASGLASRTFDADAAYANAVAKQTVVHQTINFNQPVQTPDEFAQMLKMYATYGLADA